jgi:hypothetical protein
MLLHKAVQELQEMEEQLQSYLSTIQARAIEQERLAESPTLLADELAQINSEIAVLKDVYQADKCMLNEQIQQQLVEKESLSRKLFALRQEMDEKDEVLKDMQAQIEKRNARSEAQIETDAEFVKKFELPSSEKMINCSYFSTPQKKRTKKKQNKKKKKKKKRTSINTKQGYNLTVIF